MKQNYGSGSEITQTEMEARLRNVHECELSLYGEQTGTGSCVNISFSTWCIVQLFVTVCDTQVCE